MTVKDARGTPHWTILDNTRWATKAMSDQIDFNEAQAILSQWSTNVVQEDGVDTYLLKSIAGEKHDVTAMVWLRSKLVQFMCGSRELFIRQW